MILNDFSFAVVIALDKNCQEAWFWKGFCEDKLNKYKLAVYRYIILIYKLFSYGHSIQLNPKDNSAWNNKGSALNS